jgi:hypothetical protein
MEHQDHSTENGASGHLISPVTSTTSSGTPSFRVYKDMGTETFANGQVNYKAADGSTKNCLDSLDDDERYKYGCRCGCTAVFSGFGRDIKAAFKVGQSTFPAIQALAAGTNNVLYDASTGAVTVTTGGHTAIEGDIAEKMRQDFAEKIRPFVSDRYIKKAVFGLTDDEIDADHAENPEQMEDVKLSDRQPPAISDLVYSLATNEGPYTLVDYARKKIKLDDGSEHDVFCGIVRTDKGKHISIPLADLALHWAERPVVEPKKLRVGLMMVASSVIGSAIGIACYLFL